MKNNILLRSEALASLNNDKWGISIGAFLIYIIITGAIGLIPVIGGTRSIGFNRAFSSWLLLFLFKGF